MIYALLLSDDPKSAANSWTCSDSSAARTPETRRLARRDQAAPHAKMPLVDLALPSLGQFSPAQYQEFRGAIQQLIECDGEIDLFEYVLQKIVLRHLEPAFCKARKPAIQYYTMRPLAGDCAVLLSALAHVGQDDPAKQDRLPARRAPLTAYTHTISTSLPPLNAILRRWTPR